MHSSEEELYKLFQEGLLVAPDETAVVFQQRMHLYRRLEKTAFGSSRFKIESVYAQIEKKRPLLPWFAALTSFVEKPPFLIPKIAIDPRASQEVLQHELIHATLASYPESIFEEFFAFETSKGIRRWVGPLFFHAYEANTLCILLILSLFFTWIWIGIGIGITTIIGRLIWMRRHYNRALQEISHFFDTDQPLPRALFFTQKELCEWSHQRGPILMRDWKENSTLRLKQLEAVNLFCDHQKK